MADIEKLKILLDGIIHDPTLESKDTGDPAGHITTFCNIAVQKVLNAFGYMAMDGMLADQMCEFLSKSQDWMNVNSGIAQLSVNKGQIGVATHPYVGHGHVAMIAPGREVYSGHWGVLCPIVANVGMSNGYMGANMAFPITETPPMYYLLKEN